jgi:hypothetical protein
MKYLIFLLEYNYLFWDIFTFSISFKYDFERFVILAKPNSDKFLLVWACLSLTKN